MAPSEQREGPVKPSSGIGVGVYFLLVSIGVLWVLGSVEHDWVLAVPIAIITASPVLIILFRRPR